MRDERGFTVLELVIALMLLGVAIFSLAQTAMVATDAQTRSSFRTTAAALAKSYMEEVKTRNPATLADESGTLVNEWGDSDSLAVFTRSLDVDSIGANLTRIIVEVDYPKASAPVVMENIIYTTSFN